MEGIQKAFNAMVSIALVAGSALAAGAAMMLLVLVLVGMVDWTGGQAATEFSNDRGLVDDALAELREAPKPLN